MTAPATLPPLSEREIQHAIRAALGRRRDVLLYRNDVGSVARPGPRGAMRTTRYGLTVGSSDLVGVLTVNGVGIALFIEVKSTSGRLSPEQLDFQALTTARGAVHLVARSVDDAVAGIDTARAALASRIASPSTSKVS